MVNIKNNSFQQRNIISLIVPRFDGKFQRSIIQFLKNGVRKCETKVATATFRAYEASSILRFRI